MADKVVIITGASRGIGRATAVELVSRGCAVSLIARSRADLEQTARLCDAAGGRALIVAGDVTHEPTLAALVDQTVSRFGRLDGVVNNAGYAPQASVEETDAELFRRVVEINLAAAMTLSRLAWPHLLRTASGAAAPPAGETAGGARRSGTASPAGEAVAPPGEAVAPSGEAPAPATGTCIVNLSSMSAVDPLSGFAAYAAAKAGLLGLTRALAREGSPHDIRSVAIILGGAETAMFRGLKGAESVPPENLLSPEEVARVIAECLTGPLACSSGEAVYLRKRI